MTVNLHIWDAPLVFSPFPFLLKALTLTHPLQKALLQEMPMNYRSQRFLERGTFKTDSMSYAHNEG